MWGDWRRYSWISGALFAVREKLGDGAYLGCAAATSVAFSQQEVQHAGGFPLRLLGQGFRQVVVQNGDGAVAGVDFRGAGYSEGPAAGQLGDVHRGPGHRQVRPAAGAQTDVFAIPPVISSVWPQSDRLRVERPPPAPCVARHGIFVHDVSPAITYWTWTAVQQERGSRMRHAVLGKNFLLHRVQPPIHLSLVKPHPFLPWLGG
jgi:hypothetical protein